MWNSSHYKCLLCNYQFYRKNVLMIVSIVGQSGTRAMLCEIECTCTNLWYTWGVVYKLLTLVDSIFPSPLCRCQQLVNTILQLSKTIKKKNPITRIRIYNGYSPRIKILTLFYIDLCLLWCHWSKYIINPFEVTTIHTLKTKWWSNENP